MFSPAPEVDRAEAELIKCARGGGVSRGIKKGGWVCITCVFCLIMRT